MARDHTADSIPLLYRDLWMRLRHQIAADMDDAMRRGFKGTDDAELHRCQGEHRFGELVQSRMAELEDEIGVNQGERQRPAEETLDA